MRGRCRAVGLHLVTQGLVDCATVAGCAMLAACAFAPTGDPERDQQRAMAAARAAQVAEAAAEAADAEEERDAPECPRDRELSVGDDACDDDDAE